MGWFSKKKKVQEKLTLDTMSNDQLKEFQKNIKTELRQSVRQIDREIFATDRLIKTAQRDVENKIKEGANKKVIKMYAKNAIQAQKTKEKHMVTKNKIKGVEYSLNQMIMNIKMTKVMGKATGVMKNINGLAKIPEISKTIMNVQMQMEKHGIINEMIEEGMEDLDDDDIDVDDRVDELIDNIEDKVHGKTKKQKNGEHKNEDFDLDEQINKLAL